MTALTVTLTLNPSLFTVYKTIRMMALTSSWVNLNISLTIAELVQQCDYALKLLIIYYLKTIFVRVLTIDAYIK